MLGAIAGDVFGASYEFRSFKDEDFDLFSLPRFFTDDTVLTIATAEVLMGDGDYAGSLPAVGSRLSRMVLYGGRFVDWLEDSSLGPYNSYGNGSAMRVSPVGWAFDTLDEVLAEAERSAAVTHNHPEGIKGAQATACAVSLRGWVWAARAFGRDCRPVRVRPRPYSRGHPPRLLL